jgi:hypothetical protein
MKRKPGPVLVLAVWSDPSAAAAIAIAMVHPVLPLTYGLEEWAPTSLLLLMQGRYCSTCVTVWLRPRCSATVQLLRVHINRHYQGRLERPLPVRCILASSGAALSFLHRAFVHTRSSSLLPRARGWNSTAGEKEACRRISGEAKHHSVRGLQSVGFGSPKSTTRLSLKAFYGLPWPLGLHARPQMGPF